MISVYLFMITNAVHAIYNSYEVIPFGFWSILIFADFTYNYSVNYLSFVKIDSTASNYNFLSFFIVNKVFIIIFIFIFYINY